MSSDDDENDETTNDGKQRRRVTNFDRLVQQNAWMFPQPQKDEETETRLHIWCTVGADKPYGKEAIQGAIEGKAWGLQYRDNPEMLDKVNDFEWLEWKFTNS